MPTVRPAFPADKAALTEIAVDSGLFPPGAAGDFGRELDTQLGAADQGHHWLVAERDGEPVAAAYYAPETFADGTYNLHFIAARKALQGADLGSTLLQRVEADLRERGARVLITETSGLEGFELTRKFYLKHGYSEEARIRDFYTAGDDKVVF